MRSMIDPDTALAIVIEEARRAAPQLLPTLNAVGLILAEPVRADADYPPFDRAMMDGFAVCAEDAGRSVKIRGEIAAGGVPNATVEPGYAVEIMTGAACPPGTESVVPVETVVRDGAYVTLPAAITQRQNVAPRGTECARDTVILDRGDLITPLAIASIVTFGIEQVCAYPRPSLAIITTGDELVPPGVTPGPTQIRNSNGPMLIAMAETLSITPAIVVHAKDSLAALASALNDAALADIVVLTGAVSAGKYDSVPDALREFGATPVFHKVTQRPGKPILFATRGRQMIFGLPGNPLSCHLGFHRYIAPAARRFMGRQPFLPKAQGTLTHDFTMKGPRSVFQLARAEHHDGAWRVTPLAGKGSADIYTVSRANALLRFEPDTGTHPAGTTVAFEWLLLNAS